jgi:hypothetical protein
MLARPRIVPNDELTLWLLREHSTGLPARRHHPGVPGSGIAARAELSRRPENRESASTLLESATRALPYERGYGAPYRGDHGILMARN